MLQSITFNSNLESLNTFAKKLAAINKPSDIILLKGELGTGKTTFARFLINALHHKMKIPPPSFIKSPTFPIMLSYNLKKYEIYHYDLYRLEKSKELNELGIFENIFNNILIVEWPEILIKELVNQNYYIIKFSFIDKSNRQIKLYHSIKNIVL